MASSIFRFYWLLTTFPTRKKPTVPEINVNMSGKSLHVESVASDLYAAIDLLMDKLDRQIVKTKTKSKEHSRDSVKNMPGKDDASA